MVALPNADTVLRKAAGEIGFREGRDNDGNWNNRGKFTTWYAERMNNSIFLTASWCAIFVSWVAWQTGALGTMIPLHAWTPGGLAWFKKRGRVVSTPRRGDIVYFYYPSMGRVAHVGFVESVSNGYIVTIEGNTNVTGSSQGNGVYRLRRKINSNQIFCRPAYSKIAPPLPATGVDNTKPKLVDSVSVAHLKSARYTDPSKDGSPLGKYADEVYTMEVALFKTEWLRWAYVDGHYGSTTVGDGSSGFGGVRGFQKKHTGTDNPDGWMGPIELGKLFKLAGMSVKVTP